MNSDGDVRNTLLLFISKGKELLIGQAMYCQGKRWNVHTGIRRHVSVHMVGLVVRDWDVPVQTQLHVCESG